MEETTIVTEITTLEETTTIVTEVTTVEETTTSEETTIVTEVTTNPYYKIEQGITSINVFLAVFMVALIIKFVHNLFSDIMKC